MPRDLSQILFVSRHRTNIFKHKDPAWKSFQLKRHPQDIQVLIQRSLLKQNTLDFKGSFDLVGNNGCQSRACAVKQRSWYVTYINVYTENVSRAEKRNGWRLRAQYNWKSRLFSRFCLWTHEYTFRHCRLKIVKFAGLVFWGTAVLFLCFVLFLKLFVPFQLP